MYIARNTVAKLLETKPSNIKSLEQVQSKIYIKLNNSEDELFMTVPEYQNCLQQLKRDREHVNYSSFVTILVIIGTLVFVTMSSIDTRLVNNDNFQADIELTAE